MVATSHLAKLGVDSSWVSYTRPLRFQGRRANRVDLVALLRLLMAARREATMDSSCFVLSPLSAT